MANQLFPAGREGILNQSIQMSTGDIRVMLVKSSYRFSRDHQVLISVAEHDNGRSETLKGRTFTDGVFDAEDTALVAIDTEECNALIFYQQLHGDFTSRLICYVDTVEGGLPFTPVAMRLVEIEHHNGPNKIFRL